MFRNALAGFSHQQLDEKIDNTLSATSECSFFLLLAFLMVKKITQLYLILQPVVLSTCPGPFQDTITTSGAINTNQRLSSNSPLISYNYPTTENKSPNDTIYN